MKTIIAILIIAILSYASSLDNDWIVIASAKPDTVLTVHFTNEIGARGELKCMALFENNKTRQYKLVAPWLKEALLEKGNITSIYVE